ncbi:MAG TPA: FxLYD domain-containing protein [Candidatus Polarisedimenticolia bacterium]|nr:FxLYD domain-containing protein [Candidatus Polarisedimenticolia bacterium]
MRQLAYFLAGIVLLGAGFGLGYLWAHKQAKPLPATKAASDSTGPCIEVLDAKLDQPDPNGVGACTLYPCVTGIVRNKCDRRFLSVLVVYNLYDETDVQVGSTQDSVSNLEPQGRARFGAQFLASPKIKQFKLVRVLAAPAY